MNTKKKKQSSNCNKIVIPEYPELDAIAKLLAERTITEINEVPVHSINSKMPYKRKYILEEVIKILQESV